MNADALNAMSTYQILSLPIEERIAIAEDTNTKSRVLRALNTDLDPRVLKALANNSSFPRHHRTARMLGLMNFESDQAKQNFIAHAFYRRKFKIDEVLDLARQPDMQWSIARNEIFMSEHLDSNRTFTMLLERSDDPFVRMRVAERTQDADLLTRLSRDEEVMVRVAVIQNSFTPPALLDNLSHDHKLEVRIAVARSPRTLASTLEHLADDRNSRVRMFAIRNGATSDGVLIAGLQDPSSRVIKAARKAIRYRNEWLSYIEAKQ